MSRRVRSVSFFFLTRVVLCVCVRKRETRGGKRGEFKGLEMSLTAFSGGVGCAI